MSSTHTLGRRSLHRGPSGAAGPNWSGLRGKRARAQRSARSWRRASSRRRARPSSRCSRAGASSWGATAFCLRPRPDTLCGAPARRPWRRKRRARKRRLSSISVVTAISTPARTGTSATASWPTLSCRARKLTRASRRCRAWGSVSACERVGVWECRGKTVWTQEWGTPS